MLGSQRVNINGASCTCQSNIELELRQAAAAPSRCTAVWHVPKVEAPQVWWKKMMPFLESKLNFLGGSVSQFLLS